MIVIQHLPICRSLKHSPQHGSSFRINSECGLTGPVEDLAANPARVAGLQARVAPASQPVCRDKQETDGKD